LQRGERLQVAHVRAAQEVARARAEEDEEGQRHGGRDAEGWQERAQRLRGLRVGEAPLAQARPRDGRDAQREEEGRQEEAQGTQARHAGDAASRGRSFSAQSGPRSSSATWSRRSAETGCGPPKGGARTSQTPSAPMLWRQRRTSSMRRSASLSSGEAMGPIMNVPVP